MSKSKSIGNGDGDSPSTTSLPPHESVSGVYRALQEKLSAEDQATQTCERAFELYRNAPESRRAAIQGEFVLFAQKVIELRRNLDGKSLLSEAAKLYRSVLELSCQAPDSIAHVPRDVDDLSESCRRGLASCGWSGLETEWLIIRLMQSQQILGSWDAHGATTVAGIRISRQELRENAAPRNEKREKFLLSLPPIPGGEQLNSEEVKHDEL